MSSHLILNHLYIKNIFSVKFGLWLGNVLICFPRARTHAHARKYKHSSVSVCTETCQCSLVHTTLFLYLQADWEIYDTSVTANYIFLLQHCACGHSTAPRPSVQTIKRNRNDCHDRSGCFSQAINMCVFHAIE